jgi:hypothetical protein
VTSGTAAAPVEELPREQDTPGADVVDVDALTDGTLVAPPAEEPGAPASSPELERDAAVGVEEHEPATGLQTDEVAERLRHRRALLDPVAIKLLQLLDQHRDMDSPSQINLGSSSVHVARWERDLVLEHHGDGEFPDRGWVTRVMDAISFQARALIDRDRLEKVTNADSSSLNQLVLTTAVGIALKTELQKTVDRLILSGDVRTATQLSYTIQRVGVAVAGCREALESSQSWPAATELAPGLTCIPQDATLPEAPPRRRRRVKRGPSEDELAALDELRTGSRRVKTTSGRRVSRVKAMFVMLVVLVAAWTALVLLPQLAQQPLETLSITDFRTVPQVRQVLARPPSLYVVVSEREWSRLSPESRLEVVDQIGEIAERADYTGAVLRLSNDDTVGRWLRAKGSSLVDRQR